VLITSRKLQHYFQEYTVSAITDYPLGDIPRNQDATGRISKWAVELGALNINFKPRNVEMGVVRFEPLVPRTDPEKQT
jgi:hypothetical protein